MSDEIDIKLARVEARLEAGRQSVRSQLSRVPPLLALWDACKAVLGPGVRFEYLQIGELEKGDRGAFEERGHRYDFDLKPGGLPTKRRKIDE